MKQSMNPSLKKLNHKVSLILKIALVLLLIFSFTKPIVANNTNGQRTVIEFKPVKQIDRYTTYKYYSLIKWNDKYYPEIIAQGKVDLNTQSFKTVFNLEQGDIFQLWLTIEPVVIDELYNCEIVNSEFKDLYLDPGDSLFINKDFAGPIFGKGANNDSNNDFKAQWTYPYIYDHSDEYMDYWLIILNKQYEVLKNNLENKKNTISRSFYTYLSNLYKYDYLSQKMTYLLNYIQSYSDSANISKTKLFENVKQIEKRIIPELSNNNFVNDDQKNIETYMRYINCYMIYQLSLSTQKYYHERFNYPNKNFFDLANQKLTKQTREYYIAYILINILGSPGKKDAVQPFYEAYLKEFPKGKFTQNITKAYNLKSDFQKGEIVPDFSLKDHTGKLVSLSSFKGKKVCLYFYGDIYEMQRYDRAFSKFDDLVRIYIYTGNDTVLFKENAERFPKAIHLSNLNWKKVKEYNVSTLIYGYSCFYILDENSRLLDFLYNEQIEELDYYFFKIFNKTNNPSKTTSNFWLIIFIITLSIIGFGGISWAVIRWRARIIKVREEKKRKLVEIELRGIRAQMNPHFMFNSLSSIQNLINNAKVQEANLYLSKFADLMRLILSNAEKSLIPIADEIEAIRSYCELEKLRFDFDYSIDIDNKLDVYNTEIPGMLIQPYVENAILHGINYLEDRKGILSISLKLTGNILKCVVDDNGIGREASESLKSNKKIKTNGFGLRLAQERLDLLNSQYKQKIAITITDKVGTEGKSEGTRVEIDFSLAD
jgi:hypothetical protein